MRLTINLATRTYINRGQLNLVLAIVFIALVSFLLVTIQQVAFNLGEISRVKGELAALAQKTGGKGRKVSDAEYRGVAEQIRFANGIIYRKSFNWLGLLDKLESVVPDGVSLITIEPKGKALKLSGTTLSFSRLRLLLENMEGSTHFTDIYLLSQTSARVGETQKGISFSIDCQVKM